MDRRERFESLNEALLVALDGWQSGLWTALPAIINSFDDLAMTVTAQPTIKMNVLLSDGTFSLVTLPLLVDVPVCFPGGGGYTLTFPIKQGDEALIVFSSRCIDAWWQLGGTQVQTELRMHDLSDGFAIIGVRSQPRVLPSISTVAAQLRSDDGTTYVEVKDKHITITTPTGGDPSCTVTINTDVATVNATENVLIDSPQTTCTGDMTVQGKLTYQNGLAGNGGSNGSQITGDLVQTDGVLSSEGTILHTHTHGGTQPGSGSTGGPN